MDSGDNNELRPLGEFWLADNPEEKLQGYLELSEKYPRLRLIGGFGYGHIPLNDVVIHGRFRLRHPSEVTLFNCFGSTTMHVSETQQRELAETTATSTLAIFGGHFQSYYDLDGVGIDFRLPHVASWFHHDCFETDTDFKNRTVTIRYSYYEEHPFRLSDDLSLELVYGGSIIAGGWGMEKLQLERPLRIRLKVCKLTSYEELRMQAHWYRCFFSWVMDHPLPLRELCLLRLPVNDEPGFHRYPVVGSSRVIEEGKFSFSDCLLEYSDIEATFPSLIEGWSKLVEEQSDSLESFFGAFLNPSLDDEHDFLAVAAACEQLKFKIDKKQVDMKVWLGALIQQWQHVMETVDNQLIDQITNTRHYYAHRTHKRSQDAVRGFLLVRLTYFLQALYSLELLRLLGMTSEKITALVANNYNLRGKLNRRCFPDA